MRHGQGVGKLVKLGLDRPEDLPDLAAAPLDGYGTEAHLQRIKQRRHGAGSGEVHPEIPLQRFHHPPAHHFGIQPLKRQKKNAEFSGIGRADVFIPDILGFRTHGEQQLPHRRLDLLRRAAVIGIPQGGIAFSGEFGIDRQIHKAAVLRRQSDGVFHHIAAARHGSDVLIVLVGR